MDSIFFANIFSRQSLLAALLIALSGCSSLPPPLPTPPDMDYVKRLVDSRFTYISDHEKWGEDMHWEQGQTGEQNFSGDCEEYADAVVYQLTKGGVPAVAWLVRTPQGEFHMVACSQGWCIDNRRPRPFQLQAQPYRWLWLAQVQ